MLTTWQSELLSDDLTLFDPVDLMARPGPVIELSEYKILAWSNKLHLLA